MKVCVYLEMSKEYAGGIKTAWRHQIRGLKKQDVGVVTSPWEDYDLLHVNTIGPKSLAAIKRAKRSGKPVIVHAHTLMENTKNSFTGSNFLAPLIKKLLRWYYRKADVLLVPSPYAKGCIREYGIHKPVRIVTNGVDVHKFKTERERGEVEKIIMVGLVFERKGLDTFIELGRRLPQREFRWYGNIWNNAFLSGDVGGKIKGSPPNVRFTGFVEDIVKAYSGGDIFLFPSRSETQGMVLLEAASCSLPLVVRDIPAYKGWLKDEKNCLKCKDLEGFEKNIKRLEENQSLRDKLAENSRKLAEKHSIEAMGKGLEAIYKEVYEEFS